MPSFAYDNLLDDAFKGNIQVSDTFHVMLVSSAYVPDMSTHTRRSDIAGEVAGAGYTAGGKAVVPTFTKNTAQHRLQIVFPAVSFPNSTITATRAVYYKRRGGAASSDELVGQTEFSAAATTANTTLTVGATTINLNTPVT